MPLVRPNGKEGDSFFRWMQRRTLHLNKNVIIAVVGATGTGKSYSCLRIGERMKELTSPRKKYNVEHCCRDLNEFMNVLNSNKIKKGDVIILEEVGINIDARKWQNKMNRLINYILQSFRNKNLVCLLNLPDIRMLDINTRRLLHGVISTKGIDKEKQVSIISFKVRQHNYESHKDYWKYLRARIDGRIKKVKLITLKKASDDLIEAYEIRRKEFTDKLNKSVQEEIDQDNRREAKKEKKGNNIAFTERQYKIQELYHKGITRVTDLAIELGVRPGTISDNMRFMTNKEPNWKEKPRK